jgi:hypothetical protein
MLRRKVEEASFDDLAVSVAEGTITRGRAIKLAGAALVGSVLAVFSPLVGEAEGQELETEGKRNRRRRRRRQQQQQQERRFIRRCKNKGRVVCKSGNKVACCPASVACSTLPDPLCNVL